MIPPKISFQPNDEDKNIIQWDDGNRYKLVSLRGIGNNFELPGKDAYLSASEIGSHKDTLAFCEKAGGAQTFIGWYLNALKLQKKQSFIYVHGLKWKSELVKGTTFWGIKSTGKSPNNLSIVKQYIDNIGDSKDVTDCFNNLNKLSNSQTDPFHFVVYEPSALKEKATYMIHALRMLRDQDLAKNFHVLLVNSSETLFLDSLVASGYLSLCECFRLGHFNKAEIEFLLKNKLNLSEEQKIEEDIIEHIQEITGGQPYLAHIFLKRLGALNAGNVSALSIRMLQNVFKQMKQALPDGSNTWAHGLKELLQNNPNLILPMQAYVNGQTLGRFRYPPPDNERSLLVTGWLAENHLKRWGITSMFHAFLGKRVLLDLERSNDISSSESSTPKKEASND